METCFMCKRKLKRISKISIEKDNELLCGFNICRKCVKRLVGEYNLEKFRKCLEMIVNMFVEK